METFRRVKASTIGDTPDQIPDVPGVYMVLLERRAGLVEALESVGMDQLALLPEHRRPILYIGSTGLSIRCRLRSHVLGDSRRSTLRMTLGVLLAPQLGFQPIGTPGQSYFEFGEQEAVLSRWIEDHVSFAFCKCATPTSIERNLILQFRPVLNITHQRTSRHARRLMQLRSRYSMRGVPRTGCWER
jgi:hypothetical protein